jgi:hypothetical protein
MMNTEMITRSMGIPAPGRLLVAAHEVDPAPHWMRRVSIHAAAAKATTMSAGTGIGPSVPRAGGLDDRGHARHRCPVGEQQRQAAGRVERGQRGDEGVRHAALDEHDPVEGADRHAGEQDRRDGEQAATEVPPPVGQR